MREGQNIDNAKQLRKVMTDAESKLWYFLRAHRFHGLKFKRQYPIGSYIADFICIEHALIIELDGGQHTAQVDYDARRDHFLQQQGFTVLRFWNNEVLISTESVLTVIHNQIFPPLPNPLPLAGEGTVPSSPLPLLGGRGVRGEGA